MTWSINIPAELALARYAAAHASGVAIPQRDRYGHVYPVVVLAMEPVGPGGWLRRVTFETTQW